MIKKKEIPTVPEMMNKYLAFKCLVAITRQTSSEMCIWAFFDAVYTPVLTQVFSAVETC